MCKNLRPIWLHRLWSLRKNLSRRYWSPLRYEKNFGHAMNGLMTPQAFHIAEIYDDGEASRHFTFEPANGMKHSAKPGQFFTLALPGYGEAAFTYLSLPDAEGRFKALIRQAGSLTSALFKCDIGDLVGFRGPFGNGWPIDQLLGKRVLIIAGGIGATAISNCCRSASG